MIISYTYIVYSVCILTLYPPTPTISLPLHRSPSHALLFCFMPPLILTKTICVATSLELSTGVYSWRYWLSQNPSFVNNSLGSFEPRPNPWLTVDRHNLCRPRANNFSCSEIFLQALCNALKIVFLCSTSFRPIHMFCSLFHGVTWPIEEVIKLSCLGMSTCLSFILSILNSYEHLHSPPLTVKRSFSDEGWEWHLSMVVNNILITVWYHVSVTKHHVMSSPQGPMASLTMRF